MKITNIIGVCYDRFKVIIIKWLYNINKDTLMFALSGLDDKYLWLWSSQEIVNISHFQIHVHVLLKAISLYINLDHLFLPWDVDVLVCTMCSSCVSPVIWTVMDSTVTFYSLWLCTYWSVSSVTGCSDFPLRWGFPDFLRQCCQWRNLSAQRQVLPDIRT